MENYMNKQCQKIWKREVWRLVHKYQQNLIMGNKLIRLHKDTALALVSAGQDSPFPLECIGGSGGIEFWLKEDLAAIPVRREREDKIVHDSAEIIYRDEFNFEWV